MGQAVLSDKELIRGYLSGDEKSFELLNQFLVRLLYLKNIIIDIIIIKL